jgi:hypothetical protein
MRLDRGRNARVGQRAAGLDNGEVAEDSYSSASIAFWSTTLPWLTT